MIQEFLREIEHNGKRADEAKEHACHWVDDALPPLSPGDLETIREELRRSLSRETLRSGWLTFLCGEVRRLQGWGAGSPASPESK